MKKILSILVSIALLSQSIWISYAIKITQQTWMATWVSVNQVTPVQWLTNIWAWFLTWLNWWKVKVNFKNINSRNAWRTMAKWTNKSNFPKEFILEKWMTIKLDEEKLTNKLVKINRIKQEKEVLKEVELKFQKFHLN